ncbi:MAG TPA: hypothetical protein VFS08_19595 [Gemmatimonadaceae bacterium]|nr:hypothetical protein [Gemmatimonadaceae bacterium]
MRAEHRVRGAAERRAAARRSDRGARDRAGITLFETVVALAIVGMTAVGALTAVGSELRAAERARRTMEAAALATQRVALLDLLTEQELLALPDSVRAGRFDEPLEAYRWETSSASAGEDGVYAVTVRVTWDGGAYVLPTRLYRRPLVVSQP